MLPDEDASHNTKCVKNEECNVCMNSKCNGNVFPENRLHCLHCAGSTCVNQSNTVAVRHPCENYVNDDTCYSVFSHGILNNF